MKPTRCDRCKIISNALIVSMFNEQHICSNCSEEERYHPSFKDAHREFITSIETDMKDFKGIGLPKDLETKYNSHKVVCIHHLDGDGLCAAAIVYRKYSIEEEVQVVFMGINYPQEPDWDLISAGDTVVIVDFSLQDEQWPKLFELTDDVIWIDHHKTAMEKESNPHDCKGIRKDGIAGAQLTWDYFYPNHETPEVVKLISDYDVWTFKFGDRTRFFQTALYNHDKYPESDLWIQLLEDDVDSMNVETEMLEEGDILTNYMTRRNKGVCNSSARWIKFESHVCCVVNNQVANSLVFDSVDPNTYDILSVFRFNGKQWMISFYSPHEHVDVSQIALKYGGGGHAKAAGCVLDELPFDFKQDDCKKDTDVVELKREKVL